MSIHSSQSHKSTSVPATCHGLMGTSCGSNVSLAYVFLLSWQTSHFCTLVSMSLFISGQNALDLARSWHFSTPWWAWCILSTMSPLCDLTITTLSPLRNRPFSLDNSSRYAQYFFKALELAFVFQAIQSKWLLEELKV